MVVTTLKCCMVVCVCCAIHACSELNDAPPRPVSFTWEVDSSLLQYGSFLANTLWGTDTNNIYLGVTNTESYKSLFHWNGKKWSLVRFPVLGLWNEVYDIDGLDSSFFVAVGGAGGSRGNAMMYDKGHWVDLRLPMKRASVTTVEVVSRNEIYVGGVDGILKYDGRSWTWMLDSTDSEVIGGSYTFWVSTVIKHPDGRLFFTSQRNSTTNLWLWNSSRFVMVDSTKHELTVARFGAFFTAFRNTLLSAGSGVYMLHGQQWKRIGDHSANCIATDNNRIIVGSFRGTIYCCSDNLWQNVTPQELRDLGRTYTLSALLFPTRYFLLVQLGFRCYILRGTISS